MGTGQKQFFLYQKAKKEQIVLKDLLQLLKSQTPGKSQSFSFIEMSSSLLPQLSLWENLQIEIGGKSWNDFLQGLNLEYQTLLSSLKDPALKAKDAENWEKLLVAIFKGILGQSSHLLVDINEEELSPFIIYQIKRIFLIMNPEKHIFVATASPHLWMDCTDVIVKKNGHEFIYELPSKVKIA
ncbi:MAG: hypothetical protein AB7I27_11620 [Bacteriovoracaceae bacterium]